MCLVSQLHNKQNKNKKAVGNSCVRVSEKKEKGFNKLLSLNGLNYILSMIVIINRKLLL